MLIKDKKYMDMQLLNSEQLMRFISEENISQLKKWGVQEARLFEWLAWTTEEYGEFVRAVNHFVYEKGSVEDVVKEGIQTITLLLKMLETIRCTP